MARTTANSPASGARYEPHKQRLLIPAETKGIPSPESARNAARRIAEGIPDRLREAFARSFCAFAIGCYWQQTHGKVGRPLRASPVAPTVPAGEPLQVARTLGEVAASLSIDEACYLLGSAYAAMLPDEARAARGVYYTPPGVVERLLDMATAAGVDWSTCRVLDPACGGGAFLGPVAARMVRAMGKCEPRVAVRNVSQRLRGFELDPFAAWISHVALDATLYAELNPRRIESIDLVDIGDSLDRTDPGSFDLVVGNPPYGRVRLTPSRRKMYSRSLYGHANLYGLFLDLALRKARRPGVVAYVTPTSFLSGEYFKRLRALLVENAPPFAIDFVGDREGVFDNVLQETALAVFRCGATPSPVDVHHVVAGASVRVAALGRYPLPTLRELPWLLPRGESEGGIVRAASSATTRLSDWGYRVATGPLVWNRHKERLRLKPGRGAVPLLWAECVSADGEFIFRALRRNHAPYFVPESNDSASLVTHSCVLLQRTTAKEQQRRLIAAHLPDEFIQSHGSVAVENHLNMIIPTSEAPPVKPKVVAAFLNSAQADRVFRCISGSVAVSAYELEAMPLPTVHSMTDVAAALDRGATRDEIERIIAGLYKP